MISNSLQHYPFLSVVLTVLVYWLSIKLKERISWANPLVISCAVLMLLLWKTHTAFANYKVGADTITWFLGPGTVALAVPMYKHGYRLRSSLPLLALIVFVGSVVGMLTAGLTAWLMGAPMDVVMAAVPKSVTTPIAIEVSKQLHGVVEITVAMVIITGIIGSILAPPFLRLLKITDDRAIGAAVGTSSHAVGTASLIHRSELQASVSSWAMAAAGIITAILAAFITHFLH